MSCVHDDEKKWCSDHHHGTTDGCDLYYGCEIRSGSGKNVGDDDLGRSRRSLCRTLGSGVWTQNKIVACRPGQALPWHLQPCLMLVGREIDAVLAGTRSRRSTHCRSRSRSRDGCGVGRGDGLTSCCLLQDS